MKPYSRLLLLCLSLASLICAADVETSAQTAPQQAIQSPQDATRLSQREDVRAFIDEMVAQHRFVRPDMEALFDQVVLKPHILEILDRPSTSRPYYEFRPNFVNAKRIRAGYAWWKAHAETVDAVSARYGVDPEYIVAILGVETMWGQDTGSFRVIDALTTITFGYPRRADYFRKELEAFLLLAREENADPSSFKGSYAGAMGMTQFMPTSFQSFAQDWDGTHHRDIWHSPGDALASVANYFAQHGWQHGAPLVVPAKVEGDQFGPLIEDKFNLHYKVSELAAFGVTPQTPLDSDPEAILAPLDYAPDVTRYWLGLNNFYVITRYNHSTLYAMAVHELATALKTAMADPSTLPPEPVTKYKKHKRKSHKG